MAKVYFQKLENLVEKLNLETDIAKEIEVKHFFNGAALYVNQTICVSWSPVGLAFKMPEREVDKLISKGKAIPLKYFPKGHVKKGYALFTKPEDINPNQCKRYFITSAAQV
ncbi:MAG: hypothetical protein COB23_07030 [Methylophaga sp.]|nr:MAG: hypothetical protein COB23_07030 [Methylophaga sp.]